MKAARHALHQSEMLSVCKDMEHSVVLEMALLKTCIDMAV